MNQTDDIQLLKKSIIEKDQQIADVEKKLRLEQFRSKKQISEITTKLENEKSTSQNYLEQRSRYEDEITDLKSKLSELDKKNNQLKEEIATIKKRKASVSTDEDSQPNNGDIPSFQHLLNLISKQGDYIPELTKLYESYTEQCKLKDDLKIQVQKGEQKGQEQLEQAENLIKGLKQSLEDKENECLQTIKQLSNTHELQVQELQTALASQLAEKDKQLAESERKIKLNTFKSNKQITELTSQVENEKAKINLLQEQINIHKQTCSELEEKLSASETKQLQLIEENAAYKKQIEQLQLQEEKVDQPTYEDLVNLIQKYQIQDEQQQQQIQSFLLVEEQLKQLAYDREQINQQQQAEISEQQQQISITEKKYSESRKQIQTLEEQLQNITQILELLKKEYEKVKLEKEEQCQELMNKIKEVITEDQINDAVQNTENMYNRMMTIQDEQYRIKEQDLINQLQQAEDKLSQVDQQFKQQEQQHKNYVKQIEDESLQNVQQKQQIITQLQKQLQDEQFKFREELNKTTNELKSESLKKEKLLEQKVQETTQLYDGEVRKIRKMEIQMKKKEKEILEEKQNRKLAEEQLQTLREKSNEMIENYENKIKEITIANHKDQPARHSIFERMSISSTDINKNFEIDILKAQIEHLQSKGDVELQAEINRLNERERQSKKEMVDLQNEIGNERLNFTVTQRQLEQEVEHLNQEIAHLKQDHNQETERLTEESRKLLESTKTDNKNRITKLEQTYEEQIQQLQKKLKDYESEKEQLIGSLKQTIKQQEEQIVSLRKASKDLGSEVQLELEITNLNERERQLRKELLDLQNEMGNQKLSQTILVRELEQQIEQYKHESQHAQQEQEYAEQIAAKVSIQYASLAMEYENAVLQNRNYRKSISKLKQ